MRVLKYLGILLFIGVGYSFIQFEQQEQQKEQVREEEIEQYEKQEVVDPSILGMITLVKTGKKSLIKQGEIEEILSQNQVVSLTQTLDTKEDLYLAGHSIPQVFGDLHDYQIGDRLLLSFQNQQQEYLNTLDRNALRLKKLIDDLFEVAKVNSGDINLHLVPVDIVALIQQAKFELDDQFKAKQLTFKTNYPNEKITLLLDSSKTYRIFQNLLINISKYALENTRVYLDVIERDNQVIITFKNISADEIKISEAKLVERFVQGDTSRNTSGSGLGLSIAKSFTEIQHGTFTINVDGDLFKATVIFNLDK